MPRTARKQTFPLRKPINPPHFCNFFFFPVKVYGMMGQTRTVFHTSRKEKPMNFHAMQFFTGFRAPRPGKHKAARALRGALCLLLVCALLLSACSGAAEPETGLSLSDTEAAAQTEQADESSGSSASGTPASSVPGHTDLNYSDMVYERPDLDAIYENLDTALALTEEEEAEEELLSLYEEILAQIVHLDTMDTLASIRNDMDLSDDYYESEVNLLDSAYNKIDNRMNELTEAVLASPYAEAFTAMVGEDFIERYEVNSRLNSPAIEDLTEQEIALVTEYKTRLAAEYTTVYNGEVVTLDDLDLSSPDALTPYYEIYAQKNAACGEIYLELVQVRVQIAEALGYDSYTDYAYDLLGRDFTKEDAQAFSEMVKKYLVPVADELYYRYYFQMYIASANVDVSVEDGIPYLQEALAAEFPAAMTEALDYMLDHDLYVFDDSPNMMASGYTTILAEYNAPFLFINTSVYTDADTLFHEFGHYYNFYLYDSLQWNDGNNLDLAEVHSQGLELLMLNYYPKIYKDNAEWMQIYVIMDLLDSVILGCCEDEFQQKVFENPDMTLEEMNELHAELYEEYMGYEVYYEWVDIHHHFETPFYYISYATSAASAFEIWAIAEEDRDAGLSAYRSITENTVNCGYLAPLEAAGLSNPFTTDMMQRLADTIDEKYLQ